MTDAAYLADEYKKKVADLKSVLQGTKEKEFLTNR